MTDLHVLDRPAAPGAAPVRTVLGLPGLGSTAHAWDALAAALPDARFVAPDLRGRGGSAQLTGPTGLRAHARDVAAVLEELDLRDVVVVGHSMGAYLAPLVAQEAGARVARLVLVDGGLRPRLPFFFRPAVVRAVFRRDLRRGDRGWPSVEAFLDANAGKALANRPDLRPAVLAMLEHELDHEPGSWRPTLDVDRAVADAVDTFFGPDVVPALDALTVEAHLLAATWQKKDGGRPFIADAVIEEWTTRQPLLTAERVEANHLTLLFAPEVAKAVAG